ncbi:hypothetical protein AOQ84DRAFT_27541 [Glonium stellatum]|uniref:Uncharacterized protein n=1 Tax=Glonium stellatum TaxID=574774 RepID=A0A8E2JTN7_9PEZI|nr:hypothetical protein AOQ84DRAFT_27541 [Glonium stellatum]
MHGWRVLCEVKTFLSTFTCFHRYLSGLSHQSPLLESLRSNFRRPSHNNYSHLISQANAAILGRYCYNCARQLGGEWTSGELHVAFRVDHFNEISHGHLLEKDNKLFLLKPCNLVSWLMYAAGTKRLLWSRSDFSSVSGGAEVEKGQKGLRGARRTIGGL